MCSIWSCNAVRVHFPVSTSGVLNGFKIIIHGYCTSVPEISPKNHQCCKHHSVIKQLSVQIQKHQCKCLHFKRDNAILSCDVNIYDGILSVPDGYLKKSYVASLRLYIVHKIQVAFDVNIINIIWYLICDSPTFHWW